jgi:exocyst complex component 6
MSNPFDDKAIGAATSAATAATSRVGSTTLRARRRREEAVRRLVTDVQSAESSLDRNKSASLQHNTETHDWLVASTVAAALERGLDRDLHTALVQEVRDNAGRIGQVCQDHADVFLDSVAQVAALGEPAANLSQGLQESQKSLQRATIAPMLLAAQQHEEAMQALQRSQTLAVLVQACRSVALQLERARKQAAAGRPRAALQAVDEARTQLSRPMEAHYGKNALLRASGVVGGNANSSNSNKQDSNSNNTIKKLNSLDETPFGKRAAFILPKIENEVLQGAKRGLNRWFLALRSGGDGPKAGRAVLRQCSTSWAVGPGLLGMGGQLPVSYLWRAKTADNLLSRVRQSGKVSRASRQGYWYDRDASKEADRLAVQSPREGIERRAEAIAAAFGWYRCWEANSDLLIDPNEIFSEVDANIHNMGGLGGSRHGLRGSRHGGITRGGLGGSRHGSSSRHGKGRSLGFRATTSSQSQAFQEITSTLGGTAANVINLSSNKSSKWNEALSPAIFYENAASSKEEDDILLSLPESVHPVRRAELAFNLLGRSEEFVQYYEQNRFGEVKVGGDSDKERKSYLSSLTGDDVTVGNDRIFFSKQLPHLCASVVGFSAVEAALELGNFAEEEESDKTTSGGKGGVGAAAAPAATLSASRFRESSERYERALVTELGSLFRSRATKASFVEFVRASSLVAAFRASLRIVHPSSAARRHDKDLFALDADILVTALKIAQDEQLKATSAIVAEDEKIPLLVTDNFGSKFDSKKNSGVPDPETVGLPFGLAGLKQQPQKADLDFQEQSRTSFNRAPMDEAYTFSQSVPVVLRSIHSRAIACAAFALSQQELGQNFPEKKGSFAAGYVLDCVEECVNVAAVGMKDSDHVVDEGSVEKAVQVMANMTALQHCLPRLFGTLIRGMTHVGLIRSDEIEDTFQYAEKILKNADKACDAQIGSTYSLVYEICRNRIDTHINYALENFNWVAKSARDMPNAYCEGLCGYLKSVFASLGPMDEGSRAGLHFSCCGHVSERLVKLFAGRPGDTTTMDDSGLQPIARIDAFGIKNLATDCAELERFADSTGVPGLRDCFDELRVLTSVMLDKELPTLLLPENAPARRRKYPILSLEKVANVLEKYVGTGLGAKLMGGAQPDILFIDKKEVTQLSKIVRTQIH